MYLYCILIQDIAGKLMFILFIIVIIAVNVLYIYMTCNWYFIIFLVGDCIYCYCSHLNYFVGYKYDWILVNKYIYSTTSLVLKEPPIYYTYMQIFVLIINPRHPISRWKNVTTLIKIRKKLATWISSAFNKRNLLAFRCWCNIIIINIAPNINFIIYIL